MKAKRALLVLIFMLVGMTILTKDVFATSSNLRCVPSTGTFKVGDTFNVDYALDTRSFPVFGADVVATFDSGIIEATTGQSSALLDVTHWTAPTTNTIDSSLGKIRLDFGNAQSSFTGNTVLGRAMFRAKAPGQAQFNFTFFQQYDDTTPGVAKVWGKRDGTNLSNILTDVNNCIYVVEAATPTTPPAAPTTPPSQPTSAAAPTAVVTELPRAGRMEDTIGLLLLSMLFLGVGGILPVFAFRKR